MRLGFWLTSGLATWLAFAPDAFAQEAFDYDVALRGGRLYLGGEALAPPGDVAVRGDRIVAVGEAPGRARREIDATGLVVSPGFIDLHNHTDAIYQGFDWIPVPDTIDSNLNFLTQGVTTIVTGNCGSGFAATDEIEAWFGEVDGLPFGSNVIQLIPHGELRFLAMGDKQAEREDPRPGDEEMKRMKEVVAAGMKAGAWGFSTGLEYDPGARAETEELVELAKVVAEYGGVYASHTRHEGPVREEMLASYAEAIEIGERAGIPAHISHIKLSGVAVHGLTKSVIALVEAARARGVEVTADQYPYAAGSTTLAMVVPVELRDGSSVLEPYCEEEGRPRLRAAVAAVMENEMPAETIQVSVYPWKWWLQGRRVSEIAAEDDRDPVDVAMDLACGWPGGGIFHTQNEADVREFMKQDWVATASDGAAMHPLFGRFTHPRLYGTYPRKIRHYVIDEGVVSLAHALRSMTILPAEAFSIPERGRLEVGYFADLVAFDLDRLRDLATFEASGVYSEGVEFVLVNGVLSIDGGDYSGDRGGRALRH